MTSTNWRDQKYAKDLEQKQEESNKRKALLAKMQAARAAKGHSVTRKVEMPETWVGRIDENNNIVSSQSNRMNDLY